MTKIIRETAVETGGAGASRSIGSDADNDLGAVGLGVAGEPGAVGAVVHSGT